jgi:hypothetical protein
MESIKMSEEEKKEKKKIIIDEDWKHEAQEEKEKLAAQEKLEKEETAQQQTKRGPLPKGDFAALVSMLVTQALFALGVIKVEGQEKEPDLEMARYNIDMLETLDEKTKGNLSEQEQQVLERTLSEVRMVFVEVSSKVDK